jgi:hypothetical protein
MRLYSLILLLVALFTYASADEEPTRYYCAGSDITSTCMVSGFEQTACVVFGHLLDCKGGVYGRNCGGCESNDLIGMPIYSPLLNTWCLAKGGMIVTSSRLRTCNT